MTAITRIFTNENVVNAFLGVAGRTVGGSYRFWESTDPHFRNNGLTPPPPVVAQRELISIGLGWIFTLITSEVVLAFNQKWKMPSNVAKLLIILIGNIVAEGIARFFAYRQL